MISPFWVYLTILRLRGGLWGVGSSLEGAVLSVIIQYNLVYIRGRACYILSKDINKQPNCPHLDYPPKISTFHLLECFNLNIQYRQMVGDQLSKFQSRVNSSIEANFSTSESTSSKQKKKQRMGVVGAHEQGPFQRKGAQIEVKNGEGGKEREEEQMQNRLFTFMDEKDYQRKMIQSFLASRTYRHQYLNDGDEGNNALLLNRANEGIERIIEDSKAKQAKQIKNGLYIAGNKKGLKSSRKQSTMGKSRTPKCSHKSINNYLTIDVRNESKTHRNEWNRSITPKYQKQQRLIRVKSNLDYTHLHSNEQTQRKQVKQVRTKKDKQKGQGSKKVEAHNISVRQLIKKKKQLEKQLTQINSSLLCRKKKTINTNPASNHKATNMKIFKNTKKSTSKLGMY